MLNIFSEIFILNVELYENVTYLTDGHNIQDKKYANLQSCIFVSFHFYCGQVTDIVWVYILGMFKSKHIKTII